MTNKDKLNELKTRRDSLTKEDLQNSLYSVSLAYVQSLNERISLREDYEREKQASLSQYRKD